MITKLFSSVVDISKAFLNKLDTVYQRYWYKEEMDFESTLAKFYKVESAALFNSGMSAISTFIHQFIIFNEDFKNKKPVILVSDQLYSLTTKWFDLLKKFGFNVIKKSADDDEFYEFMKHKEVKVVFTEIAGNGPDLPQVNIAVLSNIIKERSDLLAVVDMTFYPGEGALTNMLHETSGRLFVLMSMTKYICQDYCTGGLILGSESNISMLKEARSMLGTYMQQSSLDKIPNTTLITLRKRMHDHITNSEQVASLLEQYNRLFSNVRYFTGIIYCQCLLGPEFLKKLCDQFGKISGSFGFEDTRLLPLGLFKTDEAEKDGLLRIAVGHEQSNLAEIESAVNETKKKFDLL